MAANLWANAQFRKLAASLPCHPHVTYLGERRWSRAMLHRRCSYPQSRAGLFFGTSRHRLVARTLLADRQSPKTKVAGDKCKRNCEGLRQTREQQRVRLEEVTDNLVA